LVAKYAFSIAAEVEKQTRLQIDPSSIQLESPLKTVGEHTIQVSAGGKSAKFKVIVEKA
jgi:ribosomal protein L9